MATVVVLGAGHWHLPLHRDALRAHHRVVGVWDTDPQAAARAGVEFGAPVFHTVADAVPAGPDLAYVLGVHDQMPGICRQLIAARIPFLLEKPGAVADLAGPGRRAGGRCCGRRRARRTVILDEALPPGSTSNYVRTRGTLILGIVERFIALERATPRFDLVDYWLRVPIDALGWSTPSPTPPTCPR